MGSSLRDSIDGNQFTAVAAGSNIMSFGLR
jgi:hypothetical protein